MPCQLFTSSKQSRVIVYKDLSQYIFQFTLWWQISQGQRLLSNLIFRLIPGCKGAILSVLCVNSIPPPAHFRPNLCANEVLRLSMWVWTSQEDIYCNCARVQGKMWAMWFNPSNKSYLYLVPNTWLYIVGLF